MLFNYLKVAFRNMVRNKVYSLINITGLAIGMATSMLIFLWVADEVSVDRQHPEGDRIYRVLLKLYREDKVQKVALTPPALAPAFKDKITLVEDACRYYYEKAGLVRSGLQTSEEQWFTYADPSFFRIFSFKLLEGNPHHLMDHPLSAVISETMAEKYFPEGNALGSYLMVKNGVKVKVTGVIRNMRNTHLIHDIIFPFSLLAEFGRDINSWNFIDYCSYVQLKEHAGQQQTEELINSYLIDEIGAKRSFIFLQPLKKMHLYSDFDYEYIEAGDIRIVISTSFIALFILMIACINFMNLTTAMSYNRYREVGWRKISGASRNQIAFQFLGESVLMALMAFMISMVIIEVFIGEFNALVEKEIQLYQEGPLLVIAGFSVIILLTGLISGSYPALFLSGVNPSDILRKTLQKGKHRVIFRKVLVIVQFTISVFLIIVTWTVWQQLNYIRHQNLGYDRTDMIVMTISEEIRDQYDNFRKDLEGKDGIVSITSAFMPPVWDGPQTTIYDWEGNTGNKRLRFYYQMVDLDFVETFRIRVTDGISFGEEHLEKPLAYYILNQEAVRQLGISDPVGKTIQVFDEGKIIGIVEDFNFQTIHKRIEPLILALQPSEGRYLFIRSEPDKSEKALLSTKSSWNSLGTTYPFNYEMYDDLIFANYSKEAKTGSMLRYFTILAIFISCLGLYGLSLFISGTRTREIAIRKVLGASTDELIRMMLLDFMKWILIAGFISWPLAWLTVRWWLSQFAYSIEPHAYVFVLSVVIALAIGLTTTFTQSLRTAGRNPAETIRYE